MEISFFFLNNFLLDRIPFCEAIDCPYFGLQVILSMGFKGRMVLFSVILIWCYTCLFTNMGVYKGISSRLAFRTSLSFLLSCISTFLRFLCLSIHLQHSIYFYWAKITRRTIFSYWYSKNRCAPECNVLMLLTDALYYVKSIHYVRLGLFSELVHLIPVIEISC